MATSAFQRLPGFRDFPPEELALRAHIQDAWRRVSRRYGFMEYDGPPLESLDLYVEKSGAEIVGQLYNFTDKGDREVTPFTTMEGLFARATGQAPFRLPARWLQAQERINLETRFNFASSNDITGGNSGLEPWLAADAPWRRKLGA